MGRRTLERSPPGSKGECRIDRWLVKKSSRPLKIRPAGFSTESDSATIHLERQRDLSPFGLSCSALGLFGARGRYKAPLSGCTSRRWSPAPIAGGRARSAWRTFALLRACLARTIRKPVRRLVLRKGPHQESGSRAGEQGRARHRDRLSSVLHEHHAPIASRPTETPRRARPGSRPRGRQAALTFGLEARRAKERSR